MSVLGHIEPIYVCTLESTCSEVVDSLDRGGSQSKHQRDLRNNFRVVISSRRGDFSVLRDFPFAL